MSKHLIGKQTFHIEVASQEDAAYFNKICAEVCQQELPHLCEQMFDRQIESFQNLRFDNIVLDIGNVPKSDLKNVLPRLIVEELKKFLKKNVQKNDVYQNKLIKSPKSDWETICYYLENAILPWWITDEEDFSLDAYIKKMFATNPNSIKKLAQKYNHHPEILKRLFLQISIETATAIIIHFSKSPTSLNNWVSIILKSNNVYSSTNRPQIAAILTGLFVALMDSKNDIPHFQNIFFDAVKKISNQSTQSLRKTIQQYILQNKEKVNQLNFLGLSDKNIFTNISIYKSIDYFFFMDIFVASKRISSIQELEQILIKKARQKNPIIRKKFRRVFATQGVEKSFLSNLQTDTQDALISSFFKHHSPTRVTALFGIIETIYFQLFPSHTKSSFSTRLRMLAFSWLSQQQYPSRLSLSDLIRFLIHKIGSNNAQSKAILLQQFASTAQNLATKGNISNTHQLYILNNISGLLTWNEKESWDVNTALQTFEYYLETGIFKSSQSNNHSETIESLIHFLIHHHPKKLYESFSKSTARNSQRNILSLPSSTFEQLIQCLFESKLNEAINLQELYSDLKTKTGLTFKDYQKIILEQLAAKDATTKENLLLAIVEHSSLKHIDSPIKKQWIQKHSQKNIASFSSSKEMSPNKFIESLCNFLKQGYWDETELSIDWDFIEEYLWTLIQEKNSSLKNRLFKVLQQAIPRKRFLEQFSISTIDEAFQFILPDFNGLEKWHDKLLILLENFQKETDQFSSSIEIQKLIFDKLFLFYTKPQNSPLRENWAENHHAQFLILSLLEKEFAAQDHINKWQKLVASLANENTATVNTINLAQQVKTFVNIEFSAQLVIWKDWLLLMQKQPNLFYYHFKKALNQASFIKSFSSFINRNDIDIQALLKLLIQDYDLTSKNLYTLLMAYVKSTHPQKQEDFYQSFFMTLSTHHSLENILNKWLISFSEKISFTPLQLVEKLLLFKKNKHPNFSKVEDILQKQGNQFSNISDDSLQNIYDYLSNTASDNKNDNSNIEKTILEKAKDNNVKLRQLLQEIYTKSIHVQALAHRFDIAFLKQMAQLLLGKQWQDIPKDLIQSSTINKSNPLYEIITDREKRIAYIAMISVAAKQTVLLAVKDLIQKTKAEKERLAKSIYQVPQMLSKEGELSSKASTASNSLQQSTPVTLALQLSVLQNSTAKEYIHLLKQIEHNILTGVRTTPQKTLQEILVNLKNPIFRNTFINQIEIKTLEAIFQLVYDALPSFAQKKYKDLLYQVQENQIANQVSLEKIFANTLIQYVLDIQNIEAFQWKPFQQQIGIQLAMQLQKNVQKIIAVPHLETSENKFSVEQNLHEIIQKEISLASSNQKNVDNWLLSEKEADSINLLYNDEIAEMQSCYELLNYLQSGTYVHAKQTNFDTAIEILCKKTPQYFCRQLMQINKRINILDRLEGQTNDVSIQLILATFCKEIHHFDWHPIWEEIENICQIRNIKLEQLNSILFQNIIRPKAIAQRLLLENIITFFEKQYFTSTATFYQFCKKTNPRPLRFLTILEDKIPAPISLGEDVETVLIQTLVEQIKSYPLSERQDKEKIALTYFLQKEQKTWWDAQTHSLAERWVIFAEQYRAEAVDILATLPLHRQLSALSQLPVSVLKKLLPIPQSTNLNQLYAFVQQLALASNNAKEPAFILQQILVSTKSHFQKIQQAIDLIPIWVKQVPASNDIFDKLNGQTNNTSIQLVLATFCKTIHHFDWYPILKEIENICQAKNINLEQLNPILLQNIIQVKAIEKRLLLKNIITFFEKQYFTSTATFYQFCQKINPRPLRFLAILEDKNSAPISLEDDAKTDLIQTLIEQIEFHPVDEGQDQEKTTLAYFLQKEQKYWWDASPHSLTERWAIFAEQYHAEAVDILATLPLHRQLSALSQLPVSVLKKLLPIPQSTNLNQLYAFVQQLAIASNNAKEPAFILQQILISTKSYFQKIQRAIDLISIWIKQLPASNNITVDKKQLIAFWNKSKNQQKTIIKQQSQAARLTFPTTENKQIKRLERELDILQFFLLQGFLPTDYAKVSQATINEMLFRQIQKKPTILSAMLLTCFKQTKALERFLQYFSDKVQQKVVEVISKKQPIDFEGYWQDMRLLLQQNKKASLRMQLYITHRKHLFKSYAKQKNTVQKPESYVEDWLKYLAKLEQKDYQPLLKSLVQSIPKVADRLHSDLSTILKKLDKTANQMTADAIESKMKAAANQNKAQLPNQGITVHNAGLVILASFLYRYFNMLELLEKRAFKDEEAAIRAVHLLQYLVTQEMEHLEHLLVFNKILCGLEVATPVPLEVDITEHEQEVSEQMYRSVLANWPKMEKSSIENLRASFIIRNGILQEKTDKWILEVESKSFDILLEFLPWTISVIKLPWMEKRLEVIWKTRH